MKKLSIISLSVFLMLFVWGCSEQTEITEPELEFTEVAIPSYLKSTLKSSIEVDIEEVDIKVTTDDGREIIGKMRFEFPVENEETLTNFEITSNIFQETDLTTDFWVNYDNGDGSLKSTNGIGACLKACQSVPEKDKQRKRCKGGCWTELGLKVLTAVGAVIAIVSVL